MDRFDRLFELNRIFQAARHPVPRRRLEESLECSRATIQRLLDDMRLYLGAPISYDRDRNGYFYDLKDGQVYELPGLWFNASELHALLSMQRLLADVQPGLLDPHLAPLQKRIDALLHLKPGSGEPVPSRIRILRAAARPAGAHFQTLAGAVAQRRRLELRYFHRVRNQTDCREVSPQGMCHYRDNWYLDAWCHQRNALRTFALDAIQGARLLEATALELPEADLRQHFEASYGIFAGPVRDEARLRFSPERARWVAQERWHPDQQGGWLADGSYELRIPYGNTPELLMDILKYGPDVEVLAPDSLRRLVAERLAAAAALYQSQ